MTTQDRSVPHALNDGMGETGHRRVLGGPEQASLYIECLGPMGQVVSRATGFVVRGRGGETFLITNRHVVTGRNSFDDDRLLKNPEGKEAIAPSGLRVALPSAQRLGLWKPCVFDLWDKDGRPTWWEHPELGWRVDVIVLPVYVDEELFDLYPVPLTPCPAQLRVATKMFVVGFPGGFDPLTAVGALGIWTGATVAWQPELNWRDLPIVLVDGRTREGQSGSPAWFVADEFTKYRSSDGSVKDGPAEGLVGVYGGRITRDSDIGYVWKRKALEAILEHGTCPPTPLVSPFDDDVTYERLLDPVAIQEDKERDKGKADDRSPFRPYSK
ncbi:hypothetical protein Scani_48760 [Streptomyces caniferus]|uniref:Serine protease n=1 Tax=Streptomyces caniferus TaxID=285557 RepID=A0A640SC36_9ACTN|nr:trypsin-like peptidase domain-containing protein [Streptomyces caniferus]GFE08608.1 hypothetical protein Scani_48760 [Streptomyces caniferus]